MSKTAETPSTSLSLIERGRGWLARQILGVEAKTFLDGVTTGGAFFNRLGVTDTFDGGRLRQPYRFSPWVQRAIGIKAGEISSVPLEFISNGKEIEDPNLEAFWKTPAVGADDQLIAISDVFEILTGWLDLAGEFFIVLDDSWLMPFPEKVGGLHPFIIARPDRMVPIVVQGKLEGWWFTEENRAKTLLIKENVIHVKRWNPYDPIRGLGAMEAAMAAAEGDFLASTYVRNLMRNNGDAGPIVTLNDSSANLTDAQQEQILRALRDRRQAAVNGSFKGMFLNGNVKIGSPELQAADAELVATRNFAKEEIFITFGVPPSMASPQASYSIGAASDRFQLVTTTCQPLAKKINGAFSRLVRQQTGDANAEAQSDWSDHVVMQQVRVGLMDTATKLWGQGMPMEQINEYLNLGMKPFAGWDVGYLPFSVVAADALSEPADDTQDPVIDPQIDEGQKAIAEMLGAVRAMKNVTPKDGFKENADFYLADAYAREGLGELATRNIPEQPPRCIRVKVRNSREAAHLAQHLAKRRVREKAALAGVDRALMKARAETLQKVDARYGPTHHNAITKDASGIAATMTFDKETFQDNLFGEMKRIGTKTLQIAGDELFNEVGKPSGFVQTPEQVLMFIKRRENLMSNVPDEIHKTVMDAISEGLQRGDTKEELAKAVRETFNTISSGRAKTIATTETGAAYGNGRQSAMKQAGVQWKQWLSAEDDRVRPDHEEADGQTVPADEDFDVGGESLRYPGDSTGDPGNVINCRCVAIAVMEGPDE